MNADSEMNTSDGLGGEAATDPPAYSLLGDYKGKAVSVTVYTHNGPEAALDLAQDAWGEKLEVPITESVDVVAVAAGEVQWIDFDNKETWPKS